MATAAGLRNQRVTFQRLSDALDEFGQSAGVWQTVAPNVPARVTPVRVRQHFAAGTTQDLGSVTIEVRHRTDITADMRALWRGTPYAIQGRPIDIGGRREDLEMLGVVDTRDTRASA